MNFYSYFVLSTLVVTGIVTHAYVQHEQFYPAVVYLSTDKMCLAVMYNFAFALFILFGKVLLRIFIGTLRDLEVEQLVDSGRGFLADTILFLVFYAPTIDNREVGTVYLIQYICCVIFMKVFHLTTQIRISHMFEVGIPRMIVNVKLVSLTCLLLCCDLMALQYFYGVASRSSTFFTWILFEALTMSTVVLVSICKYSVHMVDLRLDNGWPGKSVCLFYIDLVHDVVSMTLFLVFMLTFFVQNPSRLPIYMMADVIQVARKLAQRLRSFRRYRRISLNMDMRFPDATDEEIDRDEYCVICRDSLFEGSKAKKLPCNHIFHIDCLRSWLVMQQVCPTCRAEISADAPVPTPPAPTQAPVAAAAAAAVAANAAAAQQAVQQAAAPGAAAAASQGGAGAATPVAAATAAPTAAVQAAPASIAAAAPAAAGIAPTPGVTQPAAAAQVAGATNAGDAAMAAASAPVAGGSAAGGCAGSQASAPAPSTAAAAAAAAAAGTAAAAPGGVAGGTGGAAAVAATAAAQRAAAMAAAAAAGARQGRPLDLGPIASQSSSPGAAAPVASLGGSVLGALPPVSEIVDALKQAEEVSKFLRSQTEFWMQQVRLIEQNHSSQGAPVTGTGFALTPPQWPLLAGTAGPAGVASAVGTSTSAPAAAASMESGTSLDAAAQMAELRKGQQERWKRSNSSLSNTST